MLAADVVVHAIDAALQDCPKALDRVRRDIAPDILTPRMADAVVVGILAADVAEAGQNRRLVRAVWSELSIIESSIGVPKTTLH